MVMEAERQYRLITRQFRCQKKFHYHVILTSYSQSQLISHDQPQLVSEILAYFQISYCITAPKGYALFGIQ